MKTQFEILMENEDFMILFNKEKAINEILVTYSEYVTKTENTKNISKKIKKLEKFLRKLMK
jgi:hypothetical protein